MGVLDWQLTWFTFNITLYTGLLWHVVDADVHVDMINCTFARSSWLYHSTHLCGRHTGTFWVLLSLQRNAFNTSRETYNVNIVSATHTYASKNAWLGPNLIHSVWNGEQLFFQVVMKLIRNLFYYHFSFMTKHTLIKTAHSFRAVWNKVTGYWLDIQTMVCSRGNAVFHSWFWTYPTLYITGAAMWSWTLVFTVHSDNCEQINLAAKVWLTAKVKGHKTASLFSGSHLFKLPCSGPLKGHK